MRKIKDPSVKNAKQKKKFPLHPFELVWYILCGLVGIWGLTYIVLGLVEQNLPISTENSELTKANLVIVEKFKLGFLAWGLIILAIAAVAIVVVLLIFSAKVDRDYEKNVRRAQRLAQLEEEELKEEAAEEQQQIVDAEVEPVEEEAPKEETALEQMEEAVEDLPEEQVSAGEDVPEEKVEEQPEEEPAEEQPAEPVEEKKE